MKYSTKLISTLLLCLLLLAGGIGYIVSAEEDTISPNLWHGDDFVVDVQAGQNGFTFLSVYKSKKNAYEMSNHMVSIDGQSHDIPQTLILVDASESKTWTPNGVYSFGSSNYETSYCCDAETGYVDGTYYKRMNLEDGDYYSVEDAAHIRAIVTNSYPYLSLDQMKKNLEREGFTDAQSLTRAEIITAVQAAIWAYANTDSGEYYYSRTFDVPSNSQWGGILHDFTNEMDVWWQTGKRVFSTNDEVKNRINALIDHLKGYDRVYAEKEQIVITRLEILQYAPVVYKSETTTVAMQVILNNSGSSENDDITLDIYVGDRLTQSIDVVKGQELYEFQVEAKIGDVIKTVVSGKQILPQGVYFYEPEGGRNVSQCVVNVATGETDVYTEAAFTLSKLNAHPKTASLHLQKTNWSGRPLGGTSFSLFAVGEKGDLTVGTYAVDESGRLMINGLLPGQYKLVETVVSDGYQPLKNEIILTVDEIGNLAVEEAPEIYLDEIGTLIVKNKLNPTKVELNGIKYLDNEVAGDFFFTLSFGNETVETVASGDDGMFRFGELSFDEEGEYVYTVSEVIGDHEDITYNTSVYTVTITVTEVDNRLNAEVSILKNGIAYDDMIRFDNSSYNPDTANSLLSVMPLISATIALLIVFAGKPKHRAH